MSRRKWITLLAALTLVAPLMFYGCGDDGDTGPKGEPGIPGQNLEATAKPETCTICHPGAGDKHQEFYDDLYQNGVIKVTGLGYSFTDNNDVVKFEMTKNGVDLDCTKVTNLNIYFAPYAGAAGDNTGLFQFTPSRDRLSIKGGAKVDNVTVGTLTYDAGTNVCTSTKPSFDNLSLLTKNGEIVLYGYDELIGLLPPSRVRMVSYPYAALLETGTVDYASAATVTGCEKCHIIPFLKHGNILGRVNDNAATDFITCKACHLDDRPGGHFIWQLLVDDTERAAELWAQATASGKEPEDFMDNTEKAKYAYKTSVMNDVHMSHAMEFEYPQSMATCATCHAGKLDRIFTDNNFVLETCKSCHPETGSAQAEKMQGLGLAAILPPSHISSGLVSQARVNCYTCHAGGFKTITGHTGYNKIIYATDNGVKYSDVIKVTIDNASFDNNLLTFSFHATGTQGGLGPSNIKPTVLVGLYGYDTKDYIAGPHERSFDDNGDGKIDSKDKRDLEYEVGTAHPRFTFDNTVPAGTWKVTAKLSSWSKLIADGVVKRAEIGVMPTLRNPALPAGDNIVALNAPSRTFDLKAKTFNDSFYPAIVNVIPNGKKKEGCNNCHDALAVGFHDPDRGGNIVVCRLCHITKQGASHLEMQSRSIDSYTHAIHTFQPFDIQTVHFDNAVESMFYDLKTESQFPTFDRRNCVSCHNAGRFNVPAQDKSLPGILSKSQDNLIGLNRAISGVPAYVTGPASRACGACHRAVMIKEDQAAELASFNQHTKDGGYLLVPGDTATLEKAINAILPTFNDGVFVDITP